MKATQQEKEELKETESSDWKFNKDSIVKTNQNK